MTRECSLTGKKNQFGNRRSHAENKTKHTFRPNLHVQRLFSEALNLDVSMKISTRALRTVDAKGGLDKFLLATNDSALPNEALVVKRRIEKTLAAKAS